MSSSCQRFNSRHLRTWNKSIKPWTVEHRNLLKQLKGIVEERSILAKPILLTEHIFHGTPSPYGLAVPICRASASLRNLGSPFCVVHLLTWEPQIRSLVVSKRGFKARARLWQLQPRHRPFLARGRKPCSQPLSKLNLITCRLTIGSRNSWRDSGGPDHLISPLPLSRSENLGKLRCKDRHCQFRTCRRGNWNFGIDL